MISLIITSQGRTYHLQRLLEGVTKNTQIPNEIVIVSNDANKNELPSNLNIKIVASPFKGFPIGKNRNYGATHATYDNLFFLDVDCIPDKYYFEQLNNDYQQFGGLVMGNPHYLKEKVPVDFKYDDVHQDAISHPHRPTVEISRKEDDYAIFWSLCFAISKKNFNKIGGFDADYIGYGAEDTDFGFMAKKENISFTLSTAIAFHQQHPIYRPPANHLEDIVYNSNVFFKKWGKWPMGGWLKTFKEKGWIDWHEDAKVNIEILRSPSNEEVESYKIEDARFV